MTCRQLIIITAAQHLHAGHIEECGCISRKITSILSISSMAREPRHSARSFSSHFLLLWLVVSSENWNIIPGLHRHPEATIQNMWSAFYPFMNCKYLRKRFCSALCNKAYSVLKYTVHLDSDGKMLAYLMHGKKLFAFLARSQFWPLWSRPIFLCANWLHGWKGGEKKLVFQ